MQRARNVCVTAHHSEDCGMTRRSHPGLLTIVARRGALVPACSDHPVPGTRVAREAVVASTTAIDDTLACGSTTEVALTLTAGHVDRTTPVDLMLVLDDSGSISPSEF